MSTLWLLHPDARIFKALQASIKLAWPSVTIDHVTRQTLPDTMPDHCIMLAFEDTPNSPAERIVVIHPDDPPLRLKPLVMQLQDLLRKSYWPTSIILGECRLDTRARVWECGEDIPPITLTEKEIALLVYLWLCKSAVTREDLLRDVWSYAAGVDTHTIETHIYRLRQKIETDPGNPKILLTTKDGYQLAATRMA